MQRMQDWVDKNTNIEQYDVCTLPRKKYIEMFTDMAILMVGSDENV